MEIFIIEGGGMGFHRRRKKRKNKYLRTSSPSTKGIWHINTEG